jgi:hypothetical protein
MSTGKLILPFLLWAPIALLGQGPSETHPFVLSTGSTPPVREYYSCVNDLGGKPFDRQAADVCLKSILSHPHFTGGNVVVEPHASYTTVKFELESPALTLTKVNFGLPPDREIEFEHLLSEDEIAPHVGETYDSSKAFQAKGKLDDFLKSKGVLAFVTYGTVLDYDQKTATVQYNAWEGPPIPPQEPVYPRPNCHVLVGNINEIDVDDYTPIQYVKDILNLQMTSCFSQEKIDQAARELKGTGIFSTLEVKISPHVGESSPDEEWRDVTLTARANPTQVGRILYKRYGLLSEAPEPKWPRIPLTVGKAYSRYDAQESEKTLETFLTKPGFKVMVFQGDRLEPDKQITVTFHLIGGTTDTLWMDGKRIH